MRAVAPLSLAAVLLASCGGHPHANHRFENPESWARQWDDPSRDAWQRPNLVLDQLGDVRGKIIAEVGSGTGFFTRRLATREAIVLALDIAPDMLITLDSLNAVELDSAAYARIEPRLVSADDPKLQPEEADAALVVNTFMYIQDGATYLKRLSEGLKSGPTVLVVDFKTENTPVGPPVQSRLPTKRVEDALREAGFVNIETNLTSLDYQYMIKARKS